MSLVGKILVIINVGLSFVFLGFAMMVYTSRVDLRGKLEEKATELRTSSNEKAELTTKNSELSQQLADEKAKLQRLGNETAQEKEKLEAEIAQLKQEIQRANEEVAKSTEMMHKATTESGQRRDEVKTVREDRNDLLKKNQELVTEKTALQDQFTQTQNDLALANARNQQIHERLKKLESYVLKVNEGVMPTDHELAGEAVPPPPDVDGVVTQVDRTGRFIQISLGEDDGIRKGQTLEVWRTDPQPRYLGKVKIFQTNPHNAVAQPLSTEGPIREKDRVGPRIVADRNAN